VRDNSGVAAKGGDTDEGKCKTCGGGKGKWVPWTDKDGKTHTHWVSCVPCNGTGER